MYLIHNININIMMQQRF